MLRLENPVRNDLAPHLYIRNAAGEAITVPVLQDDFTIGRSSENDLVVPEAHVSRKHAEILRDGESYRLIDRSSRAGTYVNGKCIVSCILADGDRITLGSDSQFEILFTREQDEKISHSLSFVTTSFLTRASAGDLQQVARFLQGIRYLSEGVPLQEVLDVALDMAIEIAQADRAFLVQLDENNQPVFHSGRTRKKKSLRPDQFQISSTILHQVLVNGQRVILSESLHPETFSRLDSLGELELRTVVCLPLRGQDNRASPSSRAMRRVIGALYLDSKVDSKGLSNISEGLLESLANDAGAVLINLELLQHAREKELLERELRTAREIQENLLPSVCGGYGFFEACAQNLPSRNISGDYYDLIPLTGGSYAVVVADVSGKGVPAALLAALVQGALYVELDRSDKPSVCIEYINRYLVRRTTPKQFVTLFLGILNADGQFCFVNAGHNPPYLIRASGEILELSTRGMVLGVREESKFEEKSLLLNSGDILCLFTDGVTEAMNAQEEFFGEERLQETLLHAPRDSASSVLDFVVESVGLHAGGAHKNDDLTLMIVRVIDSSPQN